MPNPAPNALLCFATLVLAALLPACHADGAAPQAPEPSSTCEGHGDDFRARMATATGSCTTDSECGCFNPVVAEAACGGITDRASADALGVIEAAFHASGCPWPHQCAAWSCEPACREGRCVNGAVGGLVLP